MQKDSKGFKNLSLEDQSSKYQMIEEPSWCFASLISIWVCRRIEKLYTEQKNKRRFFKHVEALKKEDEQLKMKMKRWRRKMNGWKWSELGDEGFLGRGWANYQKVLQGFFREENSKESLNNELKI